jgi:hypothetical protein
VTVAEKEFNSTSTHLLQEVSEGAEVDGVGVAERAVDVEQDGFQRRHLRQGAAASELRRQSEVDERRAGVPCFSGGQERSPGEERPETNRDGSQWRTCWSPCPPE